MADELDILRRANPVTAADPRFHDRPLDQHAERRLNRLLHGERDSGRPRPLRRWVWSVAGAATVGVVVLTLTLSGSTTTPAVAAPRPLMVEAGSTPVPLDRLADAVAASGGSLRLVQGTHVQTWSMGMGPGARPPITVPEERVVRWKADDSHTELVVATDPRHPGRPVLTDADPAPARSRTGTSSAGRPTRRAGATPRRWPRRRATPSGCAPTSRRSTSGGRWTPPDSSTPSASC